MPCGVHCVYGIGYRSTYSDPAQSHARYQELVCSIVPEMVGYLSIYVSCIIQHMMGCRCGNVCGHGTIMHDIIACGAVFSAAHVRNCATTVCNRTHDVG